MTLAEHVEGTDDLYSSVAVSTVRPPTAVREAPPAPCASWCSAPSSLRLGAPLVEVLGDPSRAWRSGRACHRPAPSAARSRGPGARPASRRVPCCLRVRRGTASRFPCTRRGRRCLLRFAVDVHDARDRPSSRSRSWLTTSSAPRYERRNLSSQSRASASRWLVGSSSRSRSLPPNRMRTSSAGVARRRERAEVEVEPIGAQADAVGELAHLGLGRVAAGRLERLLRVAEALDVLGGGVLLQGDAQLLGAGRDRRVRARRTRGRGRWCRRGRRRCEGPATGTR